MPSLQTDYLDALTFRSKHVRALESLGNHRGRQALFMAQRPEHLEALRQSAIVASTVASNRIEGVEIDTLQVQALMQPGARPKSRSEQEVAGYRDALELIHDAHADMPIQPGTIRQLHKIMYRYHPSPGGEYKRQDNTIIETLPGHATPRVRFAPTSALATPSAMESLCAHYRAQFDRDEASLLVLIALFVLDFLCVHPFADGNGRVSRLLTLLLLYQAGYEVGRYISLERIIEQRKDGYYESLEASSVGWHQSRHDVLPWLEYFFGVLEASYSEFEERVQALLDSSKSKREAVELVAMALPVPFRTADVVERLPHISRSTISKTLAGLKSRGKLSSEGAGRGTVWSRP